MSTTKKNVGTSKPTSKPSTKKALPDLRPVLVRMNVLINQYVNTMNPDTHEPVATATAIMANRPVSGSGTVILRDGTKADYDLNGFHISRLQYGYNGEAPTLVRADRHVDKKIRYLFELGTKENSPEAFLEAIHEVGYLLTAILTGRQSNPGKRERGYTSSTQAAILLALMGEFGFTFENVKTSNRHGEGDSDWSAVTLEYGDVPPEAWTGYLKVMSSGIGIAKMEKKRDIPTGRGEVYPPNNPGALKVVLK